MMEVEDNKVIITVWAKFLALELAIVYIALYIGELGRIFVEAFYNKELDPFVVRAVVIAISSFISVFIISMKLFKNKFSINVKNKIKLHLILAQFAIMFLICIYGFVAVEINVNDFKDNRLISKYIEYIDIQSMIKEVRMLWIQVGGAYLIASEISSFLVFMNLNKWLVKSENMVNTSIPNDDAIQI